MKNQAVLVILRQVTFLLLLMWMCVPPEPAADIIAWQGRGYAVQWMKRFSGPDDDVVRMRPVENASPIYHDGVIYTGNSSGTFFAILAETGEVFWRFPAAGPIESEPLLEGNVLYFGDSSGAFYSLKAEDGTLRWSFQAGGVIFARPLVVKEKVIVFNSEDRMFALQKESGEVSWVRSLREEGSTPGNAVHGSSSPVFYNGNIYIGTSQGLLGCVKPSGDVLWQKSLGESGGDYGDIDAEVVVLKDMLVVPTPGDYCFGIRPENGEIAWRIEARGYTSGVVDTSERVCLPLVLKTVERGEVLEIRCIDPKSGVKKWGSDNLKEIDLNREYGWSTTKPLIVKNRLLIGLSGLGMAIIESETGKISGFFPTSSGISADPVRGERDEVYVHSNDGYLYRILIL